MPRRRQGNLIRSALIAAILIALSASFFNLFMTEKMDGAKSSISEEVPQRASVSNIPNDEELVSNTTIESDPTPMNPEKTDAPEKVLASHKTDSYKPEYPNFNSLEWKYEQLFRRFSGRPNSPDIIYKKLNEYNPKIFTGLTDIRQGSFLTFGKEFFEKLRKNCSDFGGCENVIFSEQKIYNRFQNPFNKKIPFCWFQSIGDSQFSDNSPLGVVQVEKSELDEISNQISIIFIKNSSNNFTNSLRSLNCTLEKGLDINLMKIHHLEAVFGIAL